MLDTELSYIKKFFLT